MRQPPDRDSVWPDASWTLGGNQTLLPGWIGGPNWTPNMDAAAAANELVQYQCSFNSVDLQARQNPAAPGFPPFVEHIPPDQPVAIAPLMPSVDVRYALTVEVALWDGAKYAFETSCVFICDVSVTSG